MRRLSIITALCAIIFTGAVATQIFTLIADLPEVRELVRPLCVLSAFAGLISYTQMAAHRRQRTVIAAVTESVTAAVAAAVAGQTGQLGVVLAEEMRVYGEARAIDSAIATEVRAAARNQAAENTMDLEDLRARVFRNERGIAAVIPLRTRG